MKSGWEPLTSWNPYTRASSPLDNDCPVQRCTSGFLERLRFSQKFVEVIQIGDEQRDDQMTEVRLCFNSEQEAIEYVLGYGHMIRLQEPTYFIEQIVQRAKAVIEMYVHQDGSGYK